MGVEGVPSVDLMAVMPHMHQRGVRQTMSVGSVGNMSCASHLENWSFHWQEFYFYKTPIAITPDTQIQVTCEYDTSSRHPAGAARLGHAQRDVPERADGRAARAAVKDPRARAWKLRPSRSSSARAGRAITETTAIAENATVIAT